MTIHRAYLYGREVAQITGTRTGIEFRYRPEILEDPNHHQISVRLPKRTEKYSDADARPFFENLLPEAEFRRLLAESLRVSEANTIGLLGAIGGECAGAVAIWTENEQPAQEPQYDPLSPEDIQSFFASDDSTALASATRRSRLSIAGAQEKLALCRRGADWFLPVAGSPSTHILKRPRRPRPGLIENEVFCMRLASASGLPSASAEVVDFAGTRVFVTERFDRIRQDDGQIRRIHQEDFCQVLGVLPSQKYESEGGPSFGDCARAIEEYSSLPIRDLPVLANWLVFNYLIGNGDAHAKNIAFWYTDEGLRLAPFYDLVSTIVYRDLSTEYAMRIGAKYDYRFVSSEDWVRFIEQSRLPGNAVRRIVASVIDRVRSVVDSELQRMERDYGPSPICEKIADYVRHRAAILERDFAHLSAA